MILALQFKLLFSMCQIFCILLFPEKYFLLLNSPDRPNLCVSFSYVQVELFQPRLGVCPITPNKARMRNHQIPIDNNKYAQSLLNNAQQLEFPATLVIPQPNTFQQKLLYNRWRRSIDSGCCASSSSGGWMDEGGGEWVKYAVTLLGKLQLKFEWKQS